MNNKVFFLPPGSSYNISFDMVIDALEANGCVVVNKRYRDCKNKYQIASSLLYLIRGVKIFHLNFIETLALYKCLKSDVYKFVVLKWIDIIHLFGGKVIWTMNNKVSHDVETDASYNLMFTREIIHKVDEVVVYCKESEDILVNDYGFSREKICRIAHGCYVPNRIPPVFKAHDKLRVLCFGLVSEYKNIPVLARAFKEAQLKESELLIYGYCESNTLSEEIHSIVDKEDNIIYKEAFIPESDINDLFDSCDIAIFPYDVKSMQNSGAVIMGLSQGKPVIVTEFGYVKDIKNKEFVVSYNYSSEEDHISKLSQILVDSEKKFKEDRKLFYNLGLSAFRFAHNELDWKVLIGDVTKRYSELLNES